MSAIFGGKNTTTKTYQRLGELQNQTAKEGEPRPTVWGRVRPISGNVIHASSVTRRMVEVGRTTVGGKGGGGKQTQIQYEERAYRTYAIRICEGPVTGIVRVWKNDKLVYDARGNAWGDKNNATFLKYAKFYLGDWDQMPDPVLEALWGAGNVPAYRGTCYMRVNNEDVTDFGGRVPAYTFEVQRDWNSFYLTSLPYTAEEATTDAYLNANGTSLPYSVESGEEARGTGGGSVYRVVPFVMDSSDGTGGALVGGTHRLPIIDYTPDPEETDGTGGALSEGVFRSAQIIYTPDPEEADGAGGSLVEGNLRESLIIYDLWDTEGVDGEGGGLISGEFYA